MAGKTVDISTILTPDTMGTEIASMWQSWDNMRQEWKALSEETRRYIFATDTTQTTNAKLPWKNKTVTPKLTQIRDNLIANYLASLFPKRKWLFWKGSSEDSATKEKREAIENYMRYVVGQPEFKKEINKVLTDYIDDGNCFVTPEWVDERIEGVEGNKYGYVGPVARRVAPLDIVFNPIANTFNKSPKIIRAVWTLGEVRRMLDAITTDETKETIEALWNYMVEIRQKCAAGGDIGSFTQKDAYLQMDGFDSYAEYLSSGYVELLFFMGDLYDVHGNQMYPNYKIIVADRHKIISKEPNPSYFGQAPVYHAGWRIRQDNLWAMGPLHNLVGMQYRIDHLENLKADVLDTIAYPVLKIKGYVEDFEWQPMERIICGDDGDVEMLQPPYQVLQLDDQLMKYAETMEQMAGAPKEAMGFRNPGEKTMYEVQRLENAYNRIFQNKIMQFEEYVLEPLLNAMLELARRKMDTSQIAIWDDELGMETFISISPSDLTGMGKLYPLAARHFAERAEVLQNLNTFANSALYADAGVRVHISGKALAEMLEEFFDIEDYEIVKPYIQIEENKETQLLSSVANEQAMMEATTPGGIAPDDTTPMEA